MASIIRFFRWPALNQEATAALVAECHSAPGLAAVAQVDAEWCFNVEVAAGAPPLDARALGVLRWLFAETFEPDQTATASSFSASPAASVVVEVGPRMAFSTAWSSNAVSIAHACGLKDVTRVERSRRYKVTLAAPAEAEATAPGVAAAFAALAHDRMTECVYKVPIASFAPTGEDAVPQAVFTVPVLAEGLAALEKVNAAMGLGFDKHDLNYYLDLFVNNLKRDPTNVEIYDMAQSNSEHSRHWFFGGRQVVDGVEQKSTLFQMVKATCPKVKKDGVTPSNSVIAFHDNSSALAAPAPVPAFAPTGGTPGQPSAFGVAPTLLHPILTAETHNFPCAVAPFPGAETGTGGRLRDVQATGRGAHTMAGVSAYCFGQLLLPDYALPWEDASAPYPAHLAHPRTIAVEASSGASDYGNKYGEPVLAGFCRSFGLSVPAAAGPAATERVEWIKPIMFTAGVGQMDARHATKGAPQPGMLVVKVGGPAYRIGLGGGAASSRVNDAASAALDFNAVQRGDAEMENRMNRLVRACVELGAANPIVSIHDQGCGGNGNVLKEIVEEQGARYDIRKVLVGDPTLSVMEIWGAEYQENNALLLKKEDEALFAALCSRENCPFSVVGTVSGDGRVVVEDSRDGTTAVDLPLALVLGALPPKVFYSDRAPRPTQPLALPPGATVASCLDRVLRLPSVASKRWLVHKVDRSVTGLVAQQQCVGPLQLPLANCAVLAQSHFGRQGIATAVGEQPIKGLLSPAAMARLTVAETLTNLMWARVTALEDVKCSGNWMWAAKLPGEGARMWDCCEALKDAMLELGVGIDGGKDSLSMAAGVGSDVVKAPGTLTLTAYASVTDVALTVTPDLKQPGRSTLVLVDLGPKTAPGRLGGTSLAHCFGQLGDAPPDLDPQGGLQQLAQLFNAVQGLLDGHLLLAGHDRSDGGLATTLLEMAFAGNCGLDVDVSPATKLAAAEAGSVDPCLAALFNEEVGVVLEVADAHLATVLAALNGLPVSVLGRTTLAKQAKFTYNGETVLDASVAALRDTWEATSFELEKRQRSPACVAAEQQGLARRAGPSYKVPFAAAFTDPVVGLPPPVAATYPHPGTGARAGEPLVPKKHKVAVLRQEGSNGDREMAAAFHAAGLDAWDVTVSDLLEGRASLADFRGVVFVGGFSYADVLDSGKGWAAVIKFNPSVLAQFNAFRARADTFSLGVCNGCQFLALLGWIPQLEPGLENGGAMSDAKQPRFVHNASGKFESRWVTLGVVGDGGDGAAPTPAVLLQGMAGARLGCWIAHGEGKAHFPDPQVLQDVLAKGLAPIRYVDDANAPTEEYPFNPNGSPQGVAALCSPDGRHLAMMPHPERCFLKWQWPWMDAEVAAAGPGDAAPWLFLFQNAKRFCDATAAAAP